MASDKTMKKRIVAVVSIISLVLLCTIALSGCIVIDEDGWFFREDFLPEYESGYYRYAVKKFEDGTKEAYIIGLTKSGLQQKTLIFPDMIDGIDVDGYGYGIGSIMVTGTNKFVGKFESENLEKLFYVSRPKGGGTRFGEFYSVFWNINSSFIGQKMIMGHDYYIKKGYHDMTVYDIQEVYIANVSYLYNYEDCPNSGCYWVDSYDQSVITFIPPDPQREGYKFGGWYKESECINKWNFAIDTTGNSISAGAEYIETYEGKYLYAKWIEERRH